MPSTSQPSGRVQQFAELKSQRSLVRSNDTFTQPETETDTSQDALVKYYNDSSVPTRSINIFLAMVMTMVGCAVNSCVLFVFLKRFPPSAIRTYMVTLASFDFLACAVGLPSEVFVTINAYQIHGEWVCKLHYVVTAWSTTTSSFTLIAIAMDRVRRVKAPTFKDDDTYRSYWAVAAVVVVGSVLTLPFVTLAGVTVTVGPPKQRWDPLPLLQSCWMENRYANENSLLLPSAFKMILALTFLGGCSLMCGSYSIIAYNIYELTRNISEEINFALDHPTRKYHLTLPDIIHEDPPEATLLPVMSRKKTQPTGGQALAENVLPQDGAFATKMHTRVSGNMPPLSIASLANRKASRMQKKSMALSIRSKQSRIKKISTAVVNFFVEPEKVSSGSGSNFVSKREEASLGHSPMNPSSPKQQRPEVAATPGRKSLRAEGQVPQGKTIIEMKPNDTPQLQDPIHHKQSAQKEQDKAVPNPLPMVNTGMFQQGADNIEKMPAVVVLTPVVVELDDNRRFSGWSLQELEMLETLAHLEEIKSNASSSMLTLIILYLATWLPNLLARLVTVKPVYVCVPLHDCWTNLYSYAIMSVYLCSTVNPFFYCFGNVHFRQQVRLVFKQVVDRALRLCQICSRPQKKRAPVIRRPQPPPPAPAADQPVKNEQDMKPASAGGLALVPPTHSLPAAAPGSPASAAKVDIALPSQPLKTA